MGNRKRGTGITYRREIKNGYSLMLTYEISVGENYLPCNLDDIPNDVIDEIDMVLDGVEKIIKYYRDQRNPLRSVYGKRV